MSNEQQVFSQVNFMKPLVGQYFRGRSWSDGGRLRLLSQDELGSAYLCTLADEIQSEVSGQGTVRSGAMVTLKESALQTELVIRGRLVVTAAMHLARAKEIVISDELKLLVRIFRLSAAIVDDQDVIAFAAPREVRHEEVVDACRELAQQDEGNIGRWTSKGTFEAAWLPAWIKPGYLALRRLYISEAARGKYGRCDDETEFAEEASEVVPKGLLVQTSRPPHNWSMAGFWVDAFTWLCIDKLVRESVTPVSQEKETQPASGASSYRIMYRGEAEALEAWESALMTDEAQFQGDGWLVWRTLKQALQNAGWEYEFLYDASGERYFHLEFEIVPPNPESGDLSWKLDYFIAHNEWPIREPLEKWWQGETRTWSVGRDYLHNPDRWFLPKLMEASSVIPAIAASMHAPCPRSTVIPADEVFEFLTEGANRLAELGVRVKVPSIEHIDSSDIRIRVHVKRPLSKSVRGAAQSRTGGWFDTRQLVDFDWKVALGDTELSAQAFEQMVNERSPLVRLGGTWKLVPLGTVLSQMETLKKSAEQGNQGSLIDVARMVLLSDGITDDTVTVDIDFDEEVQDVQGLIRALLSARRPQPVNPPQSFHGTLRHYQQLGFEWLLHLRGIGCGGVLADDMGLGKTIQVLSYWAYLKENGHSKASHLLICPTSLLQNWRAELTKFTPSLRVYVHHGGARVSERVALAEVIDRYDVVMTTYATAVRDADALMSVVWDSVVVDEAQNVKNPDTKQAQVVCQLNASHRIALTGTPIENRLEELWSICRFAVPGYLGGLTWFRRQFVDPIVTDATQDASRQLHQLLQPVLLRRSKTDPSIQLQLPEKWEVREYAGLTTEQGALYQSVVNRLFLDIEGHLAGMSRRGQILTALVRLKQICDHPCLSVGGTASSGRSGKLRLLLDLLEDAVSDGEAALVFTQFRGMGEILCEAISQRFGWKPKFLHGGLTPGARGEMVESFQTGRDKTPVLVLSLKAGGVGLNLTRANHVFHYDRWWNPAVEDQATDRVFRIGQTRNVQVHKLVCPGTLEERIDELIRTKRSLSRAVVGESEGWLTEMDNDSLRTLFELDASTAVEEGDEW